MPRVTIYTTDYCGFCHAAKSLLRKKGIAYYEIDVTFDPEERKRMRERSGGRWTVPQIFIGETHVGGSAELFDLERQGQLEPLLA
jgi:glutaredoxin 3